MVTPIRKGGNKDEPSNYRGITLLNSIGKIFTSIRNVRLTEWAEERSLLPESQFGFRENRRTIDCVFILNTLIENTLSKHNTLYVCYVDFKKAFDCVDHSLLWANWE